MHTYSVFMLLLLLIVFIVYIHAFQCKQQLQRRYYYEKGLTLCLKLIKLLQKWNKKEKSQEKYNQTVKNNRKYIEYKTYNKTINK